MNHENAERRSVVKAELTAIAFRDAENKPNPMSDQALKTARKFGVTL